MTLLAIDPGPTESAFVELTESGRLHSFGYWPNDRLLNLDLLRYGAQAGNRLAVEMIASYGMAVGREVFETCVWIGRFVQVWGGEFNLVYRMQVKSELCHSAKANDSNIRQALIDRWGGKAVAIGTKKSPGPLYGVSGDVWQALAVAVAFQSTNPATATPSRLVANQEPSQ